MDRELTRNLTQVVLWTGMIALTALGGGSGGVVGAVVARIWLTSKPEKPTFGGKNLSISISQKWLFVGLAVIGATIAGTAFYFLFHTAISAELPGYL